MIQYHRQPFLTLTAAKVMVGCGFAVFLGGIISEALLPYSWIASNSMFAGLGLQLFTDWKNGNKEKCKETGLRLLTGLAIFGLLSIIMTITGTF